MKRERGSVVVFSVVLGVLLFIYNVDAQCSSLTNCGACTGGSCTWCSSTQTCGNAGSTCDGDFCSKTRSPAVNASFVTRCAKRTCGLYSNCWDCNSNGCGWCEETEQCMESPLVIPASSGPCLTAGSTGPCSQSSGCWKSNFGRYDNFKCPMKKCSEYWNCKECAQNGCGWCETSQTCIGLSRNNTATCGSNNCDSNQLKTSQFGYCPSQSCSAYTDCGSCAKNGCGWCDSTSTCVAVDVRGNATCPAPPGSAPNSCLKVSSPSLSAVFTTTNKCPSSDCLAYDNCYDCATNGCGWCETTQTCGAVTNDGKAFCGSTTCNSTCLKSRVNATSPLFCARKQCSAYNNCHSCQQSGCGWCDSLSTCLPINKAKTNTCGDITCPNSQTCLKTTPTGVSSFLSKCPAQDCAAATSCSSCVANGCGWCSETSTCLPIPAIGNNATACATCSQQCFKTDFGYASKDKCPAAYCSDLLSCGKCTKGGCGWDATLGVCRELDKSGNNICGSTDPATFSTQCFKPETSMCPPETSTICSAKTDCSSCANVLGCAWCQDTSSCIELDKSNTVNVCTGCNNYNLFRCPADGEPTCQGFGIPLQYRKPVNITNPAAKDAAFCSVVFAPFVPLTAASNSTFDYLGELSSVPMSPQSDFVSTLTFATSATPKCGSAGMSIVSENYEKVILFGVKAGRIQVQSFEYGRETSSACNVGFNVTSPYVDLKVEVVNFVPGFYARHSSEVEYKLICVSNMVSTPFGEPNFRIGGYALGCTTSSVYAGFTSFEYSNTSSTVFRPLQSVWLGSMTTTSKNLYFGADNVTISGDASMSINVPTTGNDFKISADFVLGIQPSTSISSGQISMTDSSAVAFNYSNNALQISVIDTTNTRVFRRPVSYTPEKISLQVYVKGSQTMFLVKDDKHDWALVGVVENRFSVTATTSRATVSGYADSPLTLSSFGVSSALCTIPNTSINARTFTCVCNSGYYGDGIAGCTACNAGSYSDYNAATCTPCPIGSFAMYPGTGKCYSCLAGYSTTAVGATTCSTCQPGKYSNAGSACLDCAAGTYSEVSGSAGCYLCPVRQFSEAGSTSCQACAGSSNPICTSIASALKTNNWQMTNHDLSGTKYFPTNSEVGCKMLSWIDPNNPRATFNNVVSSGGVAYVSAPQVTTIYALSIESNLREKWKAVLPISELESVSVMAIDSSLNLLFALVTPSLRLFAINTADGSIRWNSFVVSGTLGGVVALSTATNMVLYSPIGLLLVYRSQLTGRNYLQLVSCTSGLTLWTRQLDLEYTIIQPIVVTIGDESAVILTQQVNTTFYATAFSLQSFTYLWTTPAISTYVVERYSTGPTALAYVPMVATPDMLVISAETPVGPQLLGVGLNNGIARWRQPYNAYSMAFNPDSGLLYVTTVDNQLMQFSVSDGVVQMQNSVPGEPRKIFSVDNKPSLYLAANDGTITRVSPDGGNIWSYKTQPTSLSIAFDSTGTPFIPVTGGVSSFPCVVETETDLHFVLQILAYLVSGIKLVLLFICFLGEKCGGSKKMILGLKKSRLALDVLGLIATSILAGLAQIPINLGIDELVASLDSPVQFKDTYLQPCTAKSVYDVQNLCFCMNKDYYTPVPRCDAKFCGLEQTDCGAVMKEFCLCDYSFYDYNCNCLYNATDYESCNIDIRLTGSPKSHILTAFDKCYNHYKTISNILWTSFAMNIGLSVIGLIASIILGAKSQSKIPTIITAVNFILVLALIIAAAVMSQNPVCQSVPNSGVGAQGAYDTAPQFTPGCIFKHEFDAETYLLSTIGSAVLVLANKPIQAFLSFVGLIALPLTFQGGFIANFV